MFVDASAMIAILTGEADGENLAAALGHEVSARPITSIIAIWEAAAGLYRKKRIPMAEAEARIKDFLEQARVEIVPLGMEELALALQAFDRYGRHRYPDSERNRALNLADCFHYACAKSNGASILHKDPGFTFTDVVSAVEEAVEARPPSTGS